MHQHELYINRDGLVSLSKAPITLEQDLEKLILNNPNLLLLPGEDHRLFVVRNQFPISDEEIKNRYALDILMVRSDAVPVLVEVKRCVDTRIKREVVAQMLDYACYLQKVTDVDLIKSFLSDSNVGDSEYDQLSNDAEFWKKVANNLSAGNMALVFAADMIPQSLKDLIDYLQMYLPKTIVYGVEISEYKAQDDNTSVIERRIHYSPKNQSEAKPRPAPREWIKETYLEKTRQCFPEITDTVSRLIAHFSEHYYSKYGNGNVYATFNVYDHPAGSQLLSMDISDNSSILWLYPASKPFFGLMRSASLLKHLSPEYQPRETRCFMKLDIHALSDENNFEWFCKNYDEQFKPE